MDETWHVERSSQQVIPELVTALQDRGLRPALTFDLQAARDHQAACCCPHHGTEQCTCQYAVLLVYAPDSQVYRTVTIHGRDGQVWLNLLKSSSSPLGARPVDQVLKADLLEILARLGSLSPAGEIS